MRQVIGDAVDTGEVIDLFAAAGLDAARLDILSEDFLNRVSALEHKNLALESLGKLLIDQIKISERTNIVQALKFREALEQAMLGYTNKQITTTEMVKKMPKLAGSDVLPQPVSRRTNGWWEAFRMRAMSRSSCFPTECNHARTGQHLTTSR